jgi:hypothetical protein
MSTRRGLSFDALPIGLLFVVVVARALFTGAEADTYWALRAGRDIWMTGHVPRFESYSFTAAGLPWPDHEWLWQALVYGLYRLGGMPLLTFGAAIVVIGAVIIVYRLMVGAASTQFVLLLLAIPLVSLVWALRPQILTLLGLAILVWLLARERLAWLPVLFLVWANAHGGVVLGGALLVAAWVTSLFFARFIDGKAHRRRALRLTILVPICALMTAATPLGFGIFRFVLESEGRLRAARINEWRPAVPGLSIDGGFWVIAVAFLVLLAWRLRRGLASRTASRDVVWADAVVVTCSLVLLPFAFRSLRHIGPFLLLAPAAASRLLGANFQWRRAPASSSPDHPGINAAIVGVAAVSAALAIGIAWARPAEQLGWRPLPEGVLTAIRSCRGPLYNHYNEGGYLVWFLPERKVFVDNRQDPFPLPFLLEHLRVESGREPPWPLFERWGIRCSFLDASSPTTAALTQAGWRSAYRDDRWAVQTSP